MEMRLVNDFSAFVGSVFFIDTAEGTYKLIVEMTPAEPAVLSMARVDENDESLEPFCEVEMDSIAVGSPMRFMKLYDGLHQKENELKTTGIVHKIEQFS